jgi:hypothetical protein
MSYYSGFPWRPGGNWEWNPGVPPMGIARTVLPTDGAHNYKRIQGVTPCVGYRNNDTGAILPSPAATAAGCTSLPYVRIDSTGGNNSIPRNVVGFGVTQPGAVHFDLAVAKNFSVPGLPSAIFSETPKLQLRLDMLNALNHPTWDTGYNGDPTSLNWGTISKQSSNFQPRYLQLSGRLSW